MPHYRPGLWETTISIADEAKPQVSQMCLDASVEQKMGVFSSFDRSKCSTMDIHRELNGDWTVKAVCDRGELGKASSSGTIHGDFNSSYHMESTSTTTGALNDGMNGTHTIVLDGKWLGPCGPGQRPGDVIVNGMKMNIIDTLNGQKPAS